MGSINGSSVANTVTTGSFTIPLMKSIGYRKDFAGAVEAAASTGGQILPPVMGAAAFVMAEFLGIPYIRIAAAAAIPAVIYYIAVMTMVHLEACKYGLKGLPKEQLPKLGKVVKARGHLIIPIIGLVYLLVNGYTPLFSAFWAIVMSLAISMVNSETRLNLKKLGEAFEDGAKSALGGSGLCLCRYGSRMCDSNRIRTKSSWRTCCFRSRKPNANSLLHHDCLNIIRNGTSYNGKIYHSIDYGCTCLS